MPAPQGAGETTQTSKAHDEGSLTHLVYTSFENAAEIRNSWDKLAGDNADFWASFDWCSLWWKHYGFNRQLEIHTFTKAGELVGAVPLFRERLWCLGYYTNLVRLVGSDHTTATANFCIKACFAHEVLEQLLEELNASEWDILHLGKLPGFFPHVPLITDILGRSGSVGSVIQQVDPLPLIVIPLCTSFEAYLQGLSSRERHNIRKERRRLESEHGLKFEEAADADGPVPALNEFIEFHQEQWTAKGDRGHFSDWPDASVFHRDVVKSAYDSGRLILRRAIAGGRRLCMSYGILFGRRVHFLLTARSSDPCWHFCFPGRVGVCDLVSKAIGLGADEVEMGVGYYPYKVKLGGRLERVYHIVAVRKGVAASLKSRLMRVESFLREVLDYRLVYLGLRGWTRKFRPSLSVRWIRTRLWPSDATLLLRRCRFWLNWPTGTLRVLSRELRRWHRIAGALGAAKYILYRLLLARRDDLALDLRQEETVQIEARPGLKVVRLRFSSEMREEEKEAIRLHGGVALLMRVEEILFKGGSVWVSYIHEKPAAFCTVHNPFTGHRFNEDSFMNVGFIERCEGFADFRGRGICSWTLKSVAKALKQEGFKIVRARCARGNLVFRRCLESAGFDIAAHAMVSSRGKGKWSQQRNGAKGG